MRGFNQITVLGNIGAEPEMRYTQNGKAVTEFTVATNRKWKNESGNMEEETTWFRVSTWEKLAETVNQYLKKGDPVFVQGRMHANNWEGKDGTKHDGLEVVANTVLFIGSRKGAEPEESALAKAVKFGDKPSEHVAHVEEVQNELASIGVDSEVVDG